MGIYTAPGVLAYVANGTHIDTDLHLSAGTYDTVIEQWDYCGGAATTGIRVTVSEKSGVFVSSPANNSFGQLTGKFQGDREFHLLQRCCFDGHLHRS